MDKVLVERPRLGGHGARKGRPPRDLDSSPRFLGLRRQVKEHGDRRRQVKEHGDSKHLNENLAPLRRYLARQVGRPWNKVYSEISAQIDKGNTVQAHVLTHIDEYLHHHVVKLAATQAAPCGVALVKPRWFSGDCGLRPGELYVDPDDGLIKRARRRVSPPLKAPSEACGPLRLAPDAVAQRLGGVWYRIDLADYALIAFHEDPLIRGARERAFLVEGRQEAEWRDPVLGPVWATDDEALRRMAGLYGAGKLAKAKRQMSARDLRRLGLSNEI